MQAPSGPDIKKAKDIAEIAQLVEHDLAKVGVASSSLVFRSKGLILRPFFVCGGWRIGANKPDYQQNAAWLQILPAAFSEEQCTLIVACSWYKPTAMKMYH